MFVYYELGKYYQNHKRYVRSRDDNQMAGKGGGSGQCAPEQYVGSQPDPSLPNQGAITPCGLIAWSFFNDSFGDAAALVGPDGAPSSVPLDVSLSSALALSHAIVCFGYVCKSQVDASCFADPVCASCLAGLQLQLGSQNEH